MPENNGSVGAVAEVVVATPPAPGAEEQKPNPPPEGEAPPEQETTEQQAERQKSKFQRRLDRHKAAAIEAKTEARLLRERLEKLEWQSKQTQETGEPKRDDIDPATGQPYDYETHLRRVARWDAKQETQAGLKADREAREGREKQQQANAGTEKVAKAWAERETAFQTANKDYEEVVAAFTDKGGEMESLSREARMAIVESDVGPALLYHLGKHPEEAERIADLSPTRQIAELGKLESKVSMPAKKTTNAPAPASTTSGGKTATVDLERMTQAEYEAHRKTQGARWAK